MVTDLVGSTMLRSSLGEDEAEKLRRAHDRCVAEAIAMWGGTLVKGLGDGALVRFEAAADALGAAVATQRAVQALGVERGVPLELRVGVAAGDVTLEDDDCFGMPVVVAARLCAAAAPAEILVTEAARSMSHGRGGHRFGVVRALDLKGVQQPVEAAPLQWTPAADAPHTAIRVLGSVRYERDGKWHGVAAAKVRAVLAVLALRAGRVVPVGDLIAALWGDDPPATATKTVQKYVVQLRQLLPAGLISTESPGYVLHLPAEDVDAGRFEGLVERGRAALASGRAPEARRLLLEASELWQGEPLADVPAQPSTDAAAAWLMEIHRLAVEALTESQLHLGQAADAATSLEALVGEEPLRERRWELLMLALYRAGRQADALEAYQRARRVLVENLGIEPGKALHDLERRILAHDPSLDDRGGGGGARPPLPPAVARTAGSPLVGREDALASLERVWAEAKAGERCVVLVGGDAGIGKTRLASELATIAHRSGGTVLAGRCHEHNLAPHQPFLEAVTHFVSHLPAEHVRTLLSGHEEAARLVPALGKFVDEPLLPPVAEAETARWRSFAALDGLLSAAAREAPVLLVVEDLHWADPTVVRLVSHLSIGDPTPLLIVVTFRDRELGTEHPLAEALAWLQREPTVRTLDLGPLDRSGVSTLAATRAGAPVADAVVNALVEGSGGNPLLVETLLPQLLAEGPRSLPAVARDMLVRRLSLLTPTARRVLELAGVVGADVDLLVLGTAAGGAGLTAGDIDDGIDEAVRAGVLLEHPADQTVVTFTHASFRAAATHDLGPRRRGHLHRAVGEAIERLYAADLGPWHPALARHFAEAAGVGEASRAAAHALAGGEAALAALAYEDATGLFELAVSMLERTRAAQPDRCDALLRLGEAQRLAGDARYRTTFESAARLARAIGDSARIAAAVLGIDRGYWTEYAKVDEPLIELMQEGLAAVGPGASPARARLLANLAKELYFTADRDRRLMLASEAVAMARRLGDDHTRVRVLDSFHTAAYDPFTLDERLAVATEAAELADRLALPEIGARAHSFLAADLLEAGDMDAAEREVSRCRELAESSRQPMVRWVTSYVATMFATVRGDFDEAEALMATSLDIGLAGGQPEAMAVFAAQLFFLRDRQGRLAEVETALAPAIEQYLSTPVGRTWLGAAAYTHFRLGRTEEAREALRAMAGPDVFRAFPVNYLWSVSLAIAGEVAAGIADVELCEVLYELLAPVSGRNVINSNGVSCAGPVDRYLGLLASAVGRHEDAQSHLTDALALAHRCGAGPDIDRLTADLADLATRRLGSDR